MNAGASHYVTSSSWQAIWP